MGIRFEILYEENPNGIYFTGQIVKGRALIHVDESIPFKGIQLRVRGYAKVRWDESSAAETSDIHFDEEKYLDAITECIDTKGLEQTLNPGTHTFTFECLLPSECPSSFEGHFGRIRYDTKIIVVRPRTFNKSYSMGFSVMKIFDLNHLPELRIPVKMEEFKKFCCGPCKSRPIILSLEMQRTSYVPGELINFCAKLINKSSTQVEQVRITLNLIALYSVRTRVSTKTQKIEIAKKKFGAFETNNKLEFRENLQVPPTPPTCEGLCQIIKITYEVAMTARVKGAHLNPVVAIPVVIGNIPYIEKSGKMSENNLIANLVNNIAPISSPDAECSPPSYGEATFIKNNQTATSKQNKQDQTNESLAKFTPKYAFYSEAVYNKQSFDETKE